MSRLSHCWLVAIVTMAFYSTCELTESTVALKADKDCGNDVSDEILFYHSSLAKKDPKHFNPAVKKDVDDLELSAEKPIIIITHGYLENSHHPSCELIRRAYISAVDGANVIVVDWSFANKGLLITARKQMKVVGKAIADLIETMTPNQQAQITLVGHSLGAHIMGIAGRQLDGKLPQIIALDPTITSVVRPQTLKLSSNAAKNVQVIHAYSYGESKALGHADFYANGPKNRPSCLSGTCTHGHAYEYFAESIISKFEFKAQKCSADQKPSRDCNSGAAVVGGRPPIPASVGKYYFETNAKMPYIKRTPGPKADSLTIKILRMRNNIFTSIRNTLQRLTGK